MDSDTRQLRERIIERLQTVVDPETGADVWRMRLVEDLSVSEDGQVSYVFRPSSPLCPIAVPLALAIQHAVGQLPEVRSQRIQVKDFIEAELLTELLNS